MIYATCPICEEPTERCINVTPLPKEEAQSLLLHAQFERAYEKHCALRGIPVDGPLQG